MHRLCSSHVSLQARKPIEINHPVLSPVILPLAKLGASAPGSSDCFGIVQKFMVLLADKQPLITNTALQLYERLLNEFHDMWSNSRLAPDVTRTVIRVVFRVLSKVKDDESPVLKSPPSILYFWLLCRLLGYVTAVPVPFVALVSRGCRMQLGFHDSRVVSGSSTRGYPSCDLANGQLFCCVCVPSPF